MDAHLTIISGPRAGESLKLNQGKFLVGRETDCQCRLDAPSVSRHHCVLILDDWALRIRDLKSKNGTYVNHCRIGAWDVVLRDADVIAVATWRVRVGLCAHATEAQNDNAESSNGTTLFAKDATHVGATASRPHASHRTV